MARTPPQTAREMNVPSHIGPNGYSPIRSPSDHNGSFSSDHSDAIELRTPPKVIKLRSNLRQPYVYNLLCCDTGHCSAKPFLENWINYLLTQIKLDDSNIWGHNSTIQPVVSAGPRILETYDSINEEYFDGDLDATDEVEKVSLFISGGIDFPVIQN